MWNASILVKDLNSGRHIIEMMYVLKWQLYRKQDTKQIDGCLPDKTL